VTGTKDILPPDSAKLLEIETKIREVFNVYSYAEMRTPIFEETSLFQRSIGEGTDIVGKEMYTFLDKGNTSLTLRPELTASVLRAFVQHNIGESNMLSKFYYIGPVFRQERPQAGRLRQFHQFGAEVLGSSNPLIDAELISLAIDIYQKFDILNYTLKVNSIGCPVCRNDYKKKLIDILSKKIDLLSPESQKRLNINPLRILDSKDDKDKKATEDVPLLLDHLCENCKDSFSKVQDNLKASGIDFVVDGRIVRGLDYYTNTAFEIIGKDLGSQDALAGGGRYDLLIEELGGKPTPGIGFAGGMERLWLTLEKTGKLGLEENKKLIYIAVIDENSRKSALKLSRELRKNNLAVDLDFHARSLKAQFREANKKNARLVLMISEDKYNDGKVELKNMTTGEQSILNTIEVVDKLKTEN
jgi:histidyl-tRNA synthetase